MANVSRLEHGGRKRDDVDGLHELVGFRDTPRLYSSLGVERMLAEDPQGNICCFKYLKTFPFTNTFDAKIGNASSSSCSLSVEIG